ncbi:MAG: dipeptidase E [Candidatus Berkelbacteria bacterium Licking1014_2]|uniref:Dipeptidase E n=1 Tax=Candidatus Berkelbacteria bacterium Licking1014_2 TaxID=2017146 RepID=A0A554LW75_9BACT|nr:MAG: dipeptidase E [Candidatus Berkelbacteria bacterium Licking1014_2]
MGRPGYPVETTKIDQEIIRITGKKNPKLLFIPTDSSDAESYFEVVKKHFGKRLGCKTDVLYLIKEKPSKKEIEEKIFQSDIVYVGGGNTLKMMKVWRIAGVDKVLKEAYGKGIVLSGVSAGSICWFRWGNSDSRRFANPNADLIKVSGLNLINALHCPHYDFEKDRKPDLKKMMKKTFGIAIAIDNCCAIEIIDDKYRIISSKASANAYKVYWKANKYHQEKIKKEKEFRLLKGLLKK